ncbi:Uncharacterised protein [Legionella pneumophila]|nr:Uncharacterised protein [Legionella pneumophila]
MKEHYIDCRHQLAYKPPLSRQDLKLKQWGNPGPFLKYLSLLCVAVVLIQTVFLSVQYIVLKYCELSLLIVLIAVYDR